MVGCAVVACAVVALAGRAEAQIASTYCANAGGPSPAVIVAPHGSFHAADNARLVATAFARAGFAVAVVQPPAPGEDDYAARLAQVVDDVAAHGVASCPVTGDITVWGTGDGAFASLSLREPHVRAIVALFLTMQCHHDDAHCDGPAAIPTLVIEGEMRPARPNATLLDVVDARYCDLRSDDDDCWSWVTLTSRSEKLQHRVLDLARARRTELIARSIEWMRSHLDGALDASRWPHVGNVAVSDGWTPPVRRTLRGLISVPLDLGLSLRDGSREIGLRPELVVARVHDEELETVGPGWGLGTYGEVVATRGATIAGGGATLVRYGHHVAIAASVGGLVRGPASGVSVGLFAGFRGYMEAGAFDLPLGLRIDGRFVGDDRTVVLSLQADLVSIAIGIAQLPAVLALGHHN